MEKTENKFFTVWLCGLLEGAIFAASLLLLFWCVFFVYPKSQSNFGMLLLAILGAVVGLILAVVTVVFACSRVNRVGCFTLALVCFAFATFAAHYAHGTSNMWYQILGVALIAPGLNFCRIGKLRIISLISNCCYLLMCGVSFFYAMFLDTGEYMSMAMVAGVGCGVLAMVCFAINPISGREFFESKNSILQILGKIWRIVVGIFLIFVSVAPFAYSIFF